MRLSIFLLIFGAFQSFATLSYSQMMKISLDVYGDRVEEVLDKIEEQSEFFFLYNEKLIDIDRKVDISIKNKPVKEVLEMIFKGTDTEIQIIDRKIILAPKSLSLPDGREQKRIITGKVTESDGEGIPGANIYIKGSNIGTISNVDGSFEIEVPEEHLSGELQVSFVGYLTETFEIAGQREINVILIPDLQQLDEVVVIGYGTVKKRDLTGSVGSVTSDELVTFPTTNAVDALQGRVAGLSIMSDNGAPGSLSTIRIRGGSSINAGSDPLWVVDGFPGANRPQAEDIESIEVLRDASATAIYGSRGANGVILVTTKKGKAGKINVEASYNYSFNQVSKTYDVLNGPEYGEYANILTTEKSPFASAPFDNPDTLQTTDWQDVIFRNGSQQQYFISLTGGLEKIRVYSSIKYSNLEGVVINSNSKELNGKLNLDVDISEKTSTGLYIDYGGFERNNISSHTWYTGTGGITGTAMIFEPWLGIYKEDGTYTTSVLAYATDNPYANAVERDNDHVGQNFTTNLFLNHEFIEGLSIYGSLGIDYTSKREGSYISSVLVRDLDNQEARMTHRRTRDINSTVYLTYEKNFADKHLLTMMAGHDYQVHDYEDFIASSREFPTDEFSYWSLGTGQTSLTPSSHIEQWVLRSFYGRLNYSFQGKYLLTLTGRGDGSSRFGANNKWAFFPSTAVRWNMEREPWLQNSNVISQLSLRAGYGTTGNTNIGVYQSLATLSGEDIYTFINGQRQTALIPIRVANSDLSWETSTMLNAGVDMGFLNGKIRFSAEFYEKQTSDMLYDIPLPQYTGYETMLANFGKLRNRGMEYTMGLNLFTRANFNWGIDFNISFNQATITKIPEGDDWYAGRNPLSGGYSHILQEGEEPNTFYGYICDGVYQEGDDFSAEPTKEPGDIKYRDINGRDTEGNLTGEPDGLVDENDRTIIGNANPDYIFGLSSIVRYKGFDLNIFINGAIGYNLINVTRVELETMLEPKNTTREAFRNAWTSENTDTDVPKVGSATVYEFSSRWIEDASYIRLKNIALGYSIPSRVIDKLKISNFRLFVSVQNALTLTKYSGFDPEINWTPDPVSEINFKRDATFSNNVERGLDYDSYPRITGYTLGVNIIF